MVRSDLPELKLTPAFIGNATDLLSFDRWVLFIEDLVFHIFAFIVDVQPPFKAYYEALCPRAVARAVLMYTKAGEALKPGLWDKFAAPLIKTMITRWQLLSMIAFKMMPLPLALGYTRNLSLDHGWKGLPVEFSGRCVAC